MNQVEGVTFGLLREMATARVQRDSAWVYCKCSDDEGKSE